MLWSYKENFKPMWVEIYMVWKLKINIPWLKYKVYNILVNQFKQSWYSEVQTQNGLNYRHLKKIMNIFHHLFKCADVCISNLRVVYLPKYFISNPNRKQKPTFQ